MGKLRHGGWATCSRSRSLQVTGLKLESEHEHSGPRALEHCAFTGCFLAQSLLRKPGGSTGSTISAYLNTTLNKPRVILQLQLYYIQQHHIYDRQGYQHRMWGTSLVAQWLRIHLPMQGTRVRALVREEPTCRGATKPVRHNYWACALEPTCRNYWSPRATTTEAHAPRARAPQQEKPLQWEAWALQKRVAPARCN